MRVRAVAETQEDFDAWVAGFQNLEPQALQADPLVERGRQLFAQKGCTNCHTIDNYADGFTVGDPDFPNLTNFGLRTSLAAGVLDNTPENLARWLKDPQKVKPTNYMPTLWETDDPNRDEEIEAIVAYLLSLGTEDAVQRKRVSWEAQMAIREPVEAPGADIGMLSRPRVRGGWLSWLTTIDHKRLGILYIVTSFIFMGFASIEAFLIRLQLARPEQQLLNPDVYNQMFTMHGVTMVFLAIMPLGIGFGNYFMPLMIGARDLAFPGSIPSGTGSTPSARCSSTPASSSAAPPTSAGSPTAR